MIAARPATVDDVEPLIALLALYSTESGYGWTVNPYIARITLTGQLEYEDAATWVTQDAQGLTGVVTAVHVRDYCDQRVGHVEKFYVSPRARGTGAGRALALAMVQWFDAQQCWHSFASATGLPGDARFANLLGRYGYTAAGAAMVRAAGR